MRFSWSTHSSQSTVTEATDQPESNMNKEFDEGGARAASRKTSKPVRRPKRARTRQRTTKYESIAQAKKREQVKINAAKKQTTEYAYSFVYVGNLESSITQELLNSTFSPCGSISRIQIRCSRGQAVTVGVAVPKDVRTARDRQYATIEFKDAKAARNALRLNGKVLDGCQLVVTVSPADLPEVQDIIRARLGDIRGRQGLPNPYHNAPRGVQTQDTEMFAEEKPVRHRFMGVSFGLCVA